MGSSASVPTDTQSGSRTETPVAVASAVTSSSSSAASTERSQFPTPTGREYDLIDELASELPNVIDEESRRQVDEYIADCDGGKGPMVACHSMAEYLSLFERKHVEAMRLYENCCFRPATDKSPNGILVEDGEKGGGKKSKAYPPSCYNLAQFRMTGKGRTTFDRAEGFRLFDRGCRAGHSPSCFLQAKMLLSAHRMPGEGVPHDPKRAAELYDRVCATGDSVACFTLATMLLRGDRVAPEADNVSPSEARGKAPIARRRNEADRRRRPSDDAPTSVPRDPARAENLLLQGCGRAHAPSCFNLAVMYSNGDDGVAKDQEKAAQYRKRTNELVKLYGGFGVPGTDARGA